ncbi:hypothetical protein SRHO_G00236300 [Serrasalmus rhombeus]
MGVLRAVESYPRASGRGLIALINLMQSVSGAQGARQAQPGQMEELGALLRPAARSVKPSPYASARTASGWAKGVLQHFQPDLCLLHLCLPDNSKLRLRRRQWAVTEWSMSAPRADTSGVPRGDITPTSRNTETHLLKVQNLIKTRFIRHQLIRFNHGGGLSACRLSDGRSPLRLESDVTLRLITRQEMKSWAFCRGDEATEPR